MLFYIVYYNVIKIILVSVICIGTRLHVGKLGIRIPVWTGVFSPLQNVRTVQRSFLLSVYRGSFAEIKRSELEVIHSSLAPRLSVTRAIPSHAQYILMKEQGKIYLLV